MQRRRYENGSTTVVSAFDPMAMVKLSGNETLASIAQDVRAKLQNVINHL
ncbi:MAG: hypothetical protein HY563_07780 [Ignavibacteriales bacterium]|nr:hypothetical protein [Ignavibacteriales bacterium]